MVGHSVGPWFHQQVPVLLRVEACPLEKDMVIALEPYCGYWLAPAGHVPHQGNAACAAAPMNHRIRTAVHELRDARRDLLGNGERRCETRGFDPEQVHKTVDAVGLRALDDEVGGGLAGTVDLGADAGVVGL